MSPKGMRPQTYPVSGSRLVPDVTEGSSPLFGRPYACFPSPDPAWNGGSYKKTGHQSRRGPAEGVRHGGRHRRRA